MESQAEKGFHIVDYIIFCSVLLVSLGIGLYHALTGGKQKTTSEYFTGDRNLRTIPVALSILVSFVSAILVLGTPAEMYTRGTQLTMRTLGYCLACVLSSLLFVPLFFHLKATSSFEYLERRFKSKAVRLIGTISMLAGNLFYMGLVMYTPSTALESVNGFPLWGSLVACGIISTIYTTLGGLRGVIWTDVFQAMVMIVGMLAIVIQGSIKVGGISEVWRISQDGGRIIFFNFDPDPTQRLTFWSTVIGGMISTLTMFGVGQSSVQRYCSLPTLSQAKRSLFLNIPGLLIVNVLAALVGLTVYAYYAKLGCDPLGEKFIANANQIVPYFVIDVLRYPGVPGIFVAVLFSGALSSMSSALNSASAVTWEDILKYFFRDLQEHKKALVTKTLVILFGGLSIMMSFLADKLGGHVLQASLSITGATSGPTLGMFILGALFPFANAKGAVIGCLVSFVFSLWMAIGSYIHRPYAATLPTYSHNCSSSVNTSLVHSNTMYYNEASVMNMTLFTSQSPQSPITNELSGLNRLYGISFLWYSAIGASITVAIGIIVSCITGGLRSVEDVDGDLVVPLCDSLCCCLPEKCLSRCRCRVHRHRCSAAEVHVLEPVKVTENDTGNGVSADSALMEKKADAMDDAV